MLFTPAAHQGEKWSATFWIHVDAYGKDAAYMLSKWKGCVDANEHCPYWADIGECDQNTAYMHAYCRLSCKLCAVGDKAEDDEQQEASGVGEAAAAA